MRGLSRLAQLWWVDARESLRDPLAALALLAPLALALAMRWGVPLLARLVAGYVDLTPYFPAASALAAVLVAVLSGMVAGFLMLDEKDDGTLVALQVTPLSRRDYALYRVASPSLLALLAVLVVIPVTALVRVPWLVMAAAGLSAALGAPIFALVLAALAGNKIEGLALAKLLSVVVALPLASLFLGGTWQILLWPVPQYWTFRFLVRAAAGAAGAELAAIWAGGMAVQILYLGLLLRRFGRGSMAG